MSMNKNSNIFDVLLHCFDSAHATSENTVIH